MDESRLLERVRALEPGKVQALLERRGARVDISMDWVVGLCKLERGEAGDQMEVFLTCGCGKLVQGGISFQTHQMWCIWASGKWKNNAPGKRNKKDIENTDNKRRNHKETNIAVKSQNQDLFPSKQSPIHGFKVHAKSVEDEVQVTTLHPSLPPSLPSLPSALVSAFQSLGRLTPRLQQGSMSSLKAGTETGLQQEVVQAWMNSLRICLPPSSSLMKPTAEQKDSDLRQYMGEN